jgi:hypothetical protein
MTGKPRHDKQLKLYEVRGGAYCFLVTAWDRGDARREANRILDVPNGRFEGDPKCKFEYIREATHYPDWDREARIWNR